jgi:hypothetical protein
VKKITIQILYRPGSSVAVAILSLLVFTQIPSPPYSAKSWGFYLLEFLRSFSMVQPKGFWRPLSFGSRLLSKREPKAIRRCSAPSQSRTLAFPYGLLYGALISLVDSRLAGGIGHPGRPKRLIRNSSAKQPPGTCSASLHNSWAWSWPLPIRSYFPRSIRIDGFLSPSLVLFGAQKTSHHPTYSSLHDNFAFHFCFLSHSYSSQESVLVAYGSINLLILSIIHVSL